MDKALTIRARVRGQNALLTLNGLVLCRLADGLEYKLAVHEFLQAGENRIQIIALSANQQGLLIHDCAFELHVELQKYRGPSVWVQPQVLFSFDDSFVRGQRLKKGRVLDTIVDLPVSFPRWRCFDVLQASADADDTLRIQDFVTQTFDLLRVGKVSALSPWFSVRNRELASAYGLELQLVHQRFCDYLSNLCRHHALSETAQNPEAWYFHRVRQSPVYALLNTQHQPLLQFQSTQNSDLLELPLHVGVLGGEVFVLR